MTLAATGHVFFEDEYTQKYEVQWTTVNGIIDITTITQQPYVWGQPAEAKIINGVLYRKGIITIHRQAIEIFNDGYAIVAEGTSQYDDYVQMNYKCEQGPMDNFKYHLNCFINDEMNIKILQGPHWGDPADQDDQTAIWCDLDIDGLPVNQIPNVNYFQWQDVWA